MMGHANFTEFFAPFLSFLLAERDACSSTFRRMTIGFSAFDPIVGNSIKDEKNDEKYYSRNKDKISRAINCEYYRFVSSVTLQIYEYMIEGNKINCSLK